MSRHLLFLTAILIGQSHAEPACSMRDHCYRMAGVQDYLKSNGSEPSVTDRELLRECMRDVRTSNRLLLAGSKPGCPIADDQAFKLLVKLGEQELGEYQARQGKKVDDVVFEDKPCFGNLCWQTSKGWAGRYHPNQNLNTEADGVN